MEEDERDSAAVMVEEAEGPSPVLSSLGVVVEG